MRRTALFLAAGLILQGCESPSDLPLVISALGDVRVLAYLDENGDGRRGELDSPLPGLPVQVRFWNSLDGLRGGVTDENGELTMRLVEVGTLRLDTEASFASDTLLVVEGADNPFTLRPDSTVVLTVGLSYPTVPLGDVAALPVGRRVFSSGIALNSRENFGDGEVHLRLGSTALRATRVDRVGVSAGDSVRIVGRTRLVEGRMTLDSARIFVLSSSVELVQPRIVSTAEAASAADPSLQAGLVRVEEALISGVRTVGPNRVVTMDDGSGAVEMVVRDYLQIDGTLLIPGTTVVRGAGLLRPTPGSGGASWQIFPRNASDLSLRAAPPPSGG